MVKHVPRRSKSPVYNVHNCTNNVYNSSSNNAFDVLMANSKSSHSKSKYSSNSRNKSCKPNTISSSVSSTNANLVVGSRPQPLSPTNNRSHLSKQLSTPPGWYSGHSESKSIHILADPKEQSDPNAPINLRLFIPTNSTNYYNTQPHGYCSFLAIQQQYLHHILTTDSFSASAQYLTTILADHHKPIWEGGMLIYLNTCHQEGLPQLSLRLRQANKCDATLHQQLFQQWLHILTIWASASDSLTSLIRTVFQLRQDEYDRTQSFPSELPNRLWPDTGDLAAFRFPFPVSIFMETQEFHGFQLLQSTNITALEQQSLVGPVFDYLTLSRVPMQTGYILFSSSHFYWGGDSRPYSSYDVCEARDDLIRGYVTSIPVHISGSTVFSAESLNQSVDIPMREQIRIRRRDDFFFQTLPNRIWLLDYLKRIPPTAPIYPDDEVRAGFQDTLSWFKVIDSPVYGKEVIFLRDLLANAFAFIYAGTPTSDSGEYVMGIQQCNIKPDFTDPYSFGARCNEYIWSSALNTVRHIEQGLVLTSRSIKTGDRSWLGYGTSYDWSPLTNTYIRDILPIMRCLSSITDTNPPPWEDIVSTCDQTHRSPHLARLICQFYHPNSDIDQPVEPLFSLMHNLNPPPGLTAEEWIEFMMRSRWTYSNFCFRRRDDPLGLYYPMYEVTKYSIPKRACSKIPLNVDYPYSADRHHIVKLGSGKPKRPQVSDSFAITQLHDISTFHFHYQSVQRFPHSSESVKPPRSDPMLPPAKAVRLDVNVPLSDHGPPKVASPCLRNLMKPAEAYCPTNESPQWPYELTDDNLRSFLFNLDGADVSTIYDIITIMVEQQADVVCILDPRLDKRFSSIQSFIRRKNLQIRVFYVPQSSTARKDERVGGVLFLTGPRLSKLKIERVCPEGSFSVLHGYFGNTPVHFLGTYWPIYNSDPRSLWQRMLLRYHKHPIEAIQGKISSSLLDIHLKHQTGFLFGDFNSDVTVPRNDKYNLAAFCQANWLHHSSTPTQLQSPSYGKQSLNGSGQSRIDYQFHNGFNIVNNRVSCFPSDLLHHIGSHRCLLASYYLTDKVARLSYRKPLNHNCNIDMANTAKVDKLRDSYASFYNEVKDICDPVEAIHEITIGSVNIAKTVFSQRSRHRYNIFSPHASALYINLNFLRKISIGVNGSKAHAPWNNRAFKRSMKSIKKQWKKQLTKVLCQSQASDVSLHDILTAHADCYGFLYWESKSLAETRDVIGVAYRETKQRLHARRRRDMRKDFSDKVKSLEEQRIAGKLRNVISYVMGSKHKAYDFQELLINGEPITNPKDIHSAITSHFRDWFSELEDAGQASNDSTLFTELLLPWPAFKVRFQKTNISEPLLLAIHSALNSGPSEAKKLAMTEALSVIPTLAEFQAVIDHTKHGTAPGISGLSYSMIKLWPVSLIEFTFQQLLVLWNTHTFPAHWSDKWIAPIPKSADPTLEALRPIALLEVLRKLWVAIIIHRIQSLFQSGGYLHPSQHGCLRGVGTDEAVLEITNALEATKEKQGDIYVASWDMKRAFDRVPKSFLVFAWLRMGVPLAIAQYLVSLDINGSTIVKTPFAQNHLRKEGPSSKLDIDFVAETGCAQGDPQSAISWNCFIDILLVALHDTRCNKAHFLNHNGLQISQLQSAYVDDILSILYSSDDLQHEADLVSAFTIISGMEISISKLKAFRFNWGNRNIPGIQHFVVHTSGWTPHQVPLASSGCFKYLGLWIDHTLSHQKQFDITKQQLLLLCDQIITAKISPETKLRVITGSLFPKLIYATKFASWYLAQYHDLDRILYRTYRTITNLLPSTSALLLTMKADHGGLELPTLSTTINERKLKLLQRLDQQGLYRKSVVQSLLGRGARSQGHILPVGHGTTLVAPLSPWWITSLIQELNLNAMSLTIHGPGSEFPTSHSIYLWDTRPVKSHNAASIQTGETGVSLLREISATVENIPLRVGQCWSITYPQNDGQQSLFEIIGFKENYQIISCVTWHPEDVTLVPGSVVLRHSNTQSAENTFDSSYDILFPTGSDTSLVILNSAIYNHCSTRKLIKSVHQHMPTRPLPFIPSEVLFDILIELGRDVRTIYTDGGWKKIPSPSDPLNHSVASGGVIILQYENGSYSCIQIAMDLQVKSVYPVELLALAAARIIARGSLFNPEIHSDSTAAINTMKSISTGKIQKQYLQYMVAHESLYAPLNLHHIKSHVEKRKKVITDWTQHETGNYIADSLTLHNWTLQQEAHVYIGAKDITISRLAGFQFSAILQAFGQRNSFAITSVGFPSLHCLKAQSQDRLKDTYISTRDRYRARRGERIKWAKRDLRTLKYTHPTNKSITDKVLRMKIIYDKHWTSSNQNKYTQHTLGNTSISIQCPLCNNGEETQQHIIHLCTHRDMEQCRLNIYHHINTQITQLKQHYPKYGNSLDTLRDMAYSHNNTFLWTGLWTADAVRRMILTVRRRNQNINIIILLKMSGVFTHETKRLYQTRASLLDDAKRLQRCTQSLKSTPPIISCFPRKQNVLSKRREIPHGHVTKEATLTTAVTPQVIMKKITQYGFLPRKKKPVHTVSVPGVKRHLHPDQLPIPVLEDLITQFRLKDPPFSFNPAAANQTPHQQSPMLPLSEFLTRFRARVTPFSFSEATTVQHRQEGVSTSPPPKRPKSGAEPDQPNQQYAPEPTHFAPIPKETPRVSFNRAGIG